MRKLTSKGDLEHQSRPMEEKTLKISMLAGLGPVWDGEVRKGVNGVKNELIN